MKAITRKIATATFMAVAVFTSVTLRGGRASAADTTDADAHPVRLFGQIGVGLVEIGHAEVGTFLGPKLAVEGMVTWAGVFGSRIGGGVFYAFGEARGHRPPRHSLLVGARLMLDSAASFDSHGDELSSYGVVPIGYGYLSDSGFFLRITVGAGIFRQRTTRALPPPDTPSIGHEIAVGGPMFNLSFGFAWTWRQLRQAFE